MLLQPAIKTSAVPHKTVRHGRREYVVIFYLQ
jgi:hypothetical protein